MLVKTLRGLRELSIPLDDLEVSLGLHNDTSGRLHASESCRDTAVAELGTQLRHIPTSVRLTTREWEISDLLDQCQDEPLQVEWGEIPPGPGMVCSCWREVVSPDLLERLERAQEWLGRYEHCARQSRERLADARATWSGTLLLQRDIDELDALAGAGLTGSASAAVTAALHDQLRLEHAAHTARARAELPEAELVGRMRAAVLALAAHNQRVAVPAGQRRPGAALPLEVEGLHPEIREVHEQVLAAVPQDLSPSDLAVVYSRIASALRSTPAEMDPEEWRRLCTQVRETLAAAGAERHHVVVPDVQVQIEGQRAVHVLGRSAIACWSVARSHGCSVLSVPAAAVAPLLLLTGSVHAGVAEESRGEVLSLACALVDSGAAPQGVIETARAVLAL